MKHLNTIPIRNYFRISIIFCLLTLCINSVWGDITYSGGYIYFADILDVHRAHTYLCARQSTWTACGELSNIAHTKLYYAANPEGSGWNGILGWVVISDEDSHSNGNFDDWTNKDWCSNWNTYGFNSGSTYVIVPSSTSKSQSVTTTYYSGGYNNLNHAQTVYKYTSTDNGSTYSAKSLNSGTVTISAYKLTGNGTASNSSNSATINTANTTSANKNAAYTGEVTLTASANAGYTFVGWFDAASGGSALSTETTYTYNAPNATKSIYARFKNETTHTVTVTYTCTETGATVKTTETPAVGEISTTTFTAGTPKGYTFSSWTVGNGLTITSGSTSSNSITVKTKSSGTYTLRANYNEDLTSTYRVRGAWTNGWGTSGELVMTKKSGHSTEDWVYASKTFDGTETTTAFKIYNSNGSTYYGAHDADNTMLKASGSMQSTEWTIENPGQNINLKHHVSGTYEFKYNTSTNKLYVTYPDVNQLQIYSASPTDASNTQYFDWENLGTASRKVLSLKANTTYEFKVFVHSEYYYTHATLINTSISNRSFTTSGSNCRLETKSAGNYTFTWNNETYKLTVNYPPSAFISASPASVYSGGTTTFTAYSSEIGSGSHTLKYEIFKGTELTTANRIYQSDNIAFTYSAQNKGSHNINYDATVDFAGNTTSQIYTVKITFDGSTTATNTVTVYRKWDIYVHDVASWGGMYNYLYGNGEYAAWPGVTCTKVAGTDTWYTVTLDAKYPNFQLNCNECTNHKRTFGGDGVYKNNITSFPAGSYWYTKYNDTGGDGNEYYKLVSVTLTNPTVEITSTEAVSCTQLHLVGNVTNNGNDGTFASDLKEVGFYVNGTKHVSSCTSSTDGRFELTVPNLTAGTAYTVKAFATNIHGTAETSTQSVSTRAAGSYTIKVRTGASDPAPKIYAWTDADGCGGVIEQNATYPSGANMTADITGVNHKWYSYSISNTYYKFLIFETGDANKTADITAPHEDKCYWYSHSSHTYGEMDCPLTTPQLYIETTAGGGTYAYNALTGSGTVTCNLTLAADSRYKFKIVYNAEFYTKSGTVISATGNTANGFAVTESAGDYCEVATTIGGSYTFSFNTSTKAVTVTYPEIPAMTGTLTLAGSGAVKGNGTSANPWVVFADNTLNITLTHSSKPATAQDHIWYRFTDAGDAQTPQQTTTYQPSTATAGEKKTLTVVAYYEYGPTGYKAQGATTTATYYYQVVERPTVSLSIPTEVAKGENFKATFETTGTSISLVAVPQFQVFMKRWNGSAWVKVGSYDYYNKTAVTTNPYTIGTAGADFVAGFYQWYVKMTYGGTVFTSEIVQNAIYQPYQVTIIADENARANGKAWFTGLYAYRAGELDKVPASANSTYPGQPREDCCTEVADYTYIYTFKYPIYTHLRLNDNSSSTVNRTEAIVINKNTCINLTGERFRGYDNWAYTTESCSNTYYRVKSVNDAFTYYSNAVQNNGDSLSFFAGPSSQLTVEKLENGIWKQTGTEISASNKPATGGIYYAIFNSSTNYLKSGIGTGRETYMKAYNGALFIRTDMAAGGWENYINNDNKFIHFDDVNSTYNNYWVRYSGDGRSVNIDAEIGNRINRCLSRHLKDRGRLADADGKVTQRNVRYSYDTRSGYFDYAVLGESTNTSYVFLSTYGADAAGDDGSNKVFKWVYNSSTKKYEKGDATRENNPTYQAKFEDLSDWRYQADVYAHADGTNNVTIGVQARLLEGLPQDLVKKETPLEALGASTTEGNYIIRIIYDFKTNTIVTGWLPGEINADKRENITADKEIAGNMILNRVEAGSTPQINITGSSKLTGLKRLYMALEIQRDNASGEYQKVRKGGSKITSNETEGDKETNLYYWISLPYDCNIEDIFGLQGSYGYMWGIFRYRGDERAQKGLFIDSGTYWELLPQNGTLKAGEGYALAIDLHYSDFNEIKIDDVTRSSKYLYFPTPNNGYTLKNIDHSATDLTDYVCTISGREQFDTGWHVVGVPGFKDVSNPGVAGTVYTPTGQAQPAFYYEYVYNTKGDAGSSGNNAYRYHTATGDTYKVFHGYCVQYNGIINWGTIADKEKNSIRRRTPKDDLPFDVATLELVLSSRDIEDDNTFVRLQSEGATAEFDMNLDLTKIITRKVPNIYSLCAEHELAGNCLTAETQTIDLGLNIPVADEYTISLRDMELPAGLQATLIDNETRLETDLSHDSYIVELQEGEYKGRLQLRLVVKKSDLGTDIEHTANGNVNATIVEGNLLLSGLTAEGADLSVFDPAGRLVYEGHAQRGETVALPAVEGVYLVRIDSEVIKVVK